MPASPRSTRDPLPVSTAKSGFTPAQASEYLARYGVVESMKAGDTALFGFLNYSQVQKCVLIRRSGPVVPLEVDIDPDLGKTRVATQLGEMSLDEYLVHPAKRAQGFILVRGGRIVFESYPGMRPEDTHIWFSSTKTMASLMVRFLVEEGKIDPGSSVEDVMPELRGGAWGDVKVIDALDMRTGMDVIENAAARENPDSIYQRINFSVASEPYKGKVEQVIDILRSAKRLKAPNLAFDYSSPVTALLTLMVESVTGRRWSDLFQERVWSRMSVESDLLMAVTPGGMAAAYGGAVSSLRDKARYGMIYTPSWPKAARERIVSNAYVREIQAGGNPDIYLEGDIGHAETMYLGGETPQSNHYQWDAVFPDGDFWKSGVMGQGLYVSPSTDTVAAFFSTGYDSQLAAFARAIVKRFR